MAKFVILLDGVLKEYTNYDEIPSSFENLISFEPDFPEGPHTEEEHEEIEQFNNMLKDLMKRETR